MEKYTLMPLPYSLDALQPVISQETVEFHYHKHHQGYVNKLNELIPGSPWEKMSLEQIVRESHGKDMKVFNQAGQIWNHNFYWNSLTTKSENETAIPEGDLIRAIESKWSSFENFQAEFKKAAAGLFGSGWAWLVTDDSGTLSIEATSNAENPLIQGKIPLLTVDVWEHAYYIDYRNERAKYLEKLDVILNWKFAMQNYSLRQSIAA
jgi:Fe-Mn family superoxide dismutase